MQKRNKNNKPANKPRIWMSFILTSIAFGLMISNSYAQVPAIKSPQATTFKRVDLRKTNQRQLPNNLPINGMTRIERNNQRIIRGIEQNQRQNSHQIIQKIYAEFNSGSITYQLPDFNSLKGATYFREALSEINKMLTGENPLDLKRAIFIAENAYFENQMDYKQFEKSIQDAVDICHLKMAEYNSGINDFVLNFTIFNYITDTTQVNVPSQEKALTHYPIKYDFNDYMGAENWSNMFVSKLMATNSGQCHSMPLYYLILAEELGAKSYLTLSPNHSFIRFKSGNDSWYNAELTCGAIISDASILESGYVKSEAIKSGIYMDTLGLHETVACMINTLANGYVHKYGYDNFVKQCSDAVRKYYPNQLNAIMLESNWQTHTTLYIAKQKENPPPKKLILDPKAKLEFLNMHKLYAQIDALGYEYMPEEHYLKWLKSLEEAKSKPENQKSFFHQILK